MTNNEKYKNYQLFTTRSWNNEIHGFTFVVNVYKLDAKSENDIVFTEKSQISAFAIQVKYVDSGINPETDIISKTISKVKTRIDFGLFEKGNEYLQVITTENLNEPFIPLEDDLIQSFLLKGLLNVRKSNPHHYTMASFDPLGFCEILKIPFDTYVFNADILVEEGFIGTKVENGIDEGSLYITSKGVKSVNLKTKSEELKKVSSEITIHKDSSEKYDIAISFAGEDRELANKIASKLQESKVRVFYDNFEKEELWGKNLYDYLSEVYSEKSKFCVMLLSESYEKKLWTNLERKSAQARAFRENREYILPIRIDDTKITGIHETVGYIDAKSHSVDEIATMILKKLSKI